MATKRRRRRPSPDESVELGLDGAMMPPPPPPEDQGSEAAGENDNSGNAKHAPAAAAPKPKRKPKRAKRPSPPPPEEEEDAGAQGSGVAPPARDPPPDELAAAAAAAVPPPRKDLKTKKTKKRSKRPPPPSQEEAEGSGDPSLARDAPADKTAAASPRREVVAPDPDHNNRGATSPPPKRPKRAAMPPPEEEERAEKRAAGAHQDGTGKPPDDTGASTDKVNNKKKKKLRKVLPKPHEPTELGLTGNRGEVPDARNTSAPQEKDTAQKEGQRREDMVEQDDAGDTSPLLMNDGAHEEEEQWEEDAEQGHANSTSPQEKDAAQEDEDAGIEVPGEAPPERNGLSPKLCSTGDRSWSHDDALKILTAMVEYAQSHDRALPDSSHLLANLTFDKTDANASKLDDKIRKLRARYRYLCSQRPPTDGQARQLFDLSHILWGKVDDDVRVEEARDFSQLSGLYPYLAKEVKVYAETLSSRHLIMAAFTTVGDEKARHLDAMCKKQRSDAFNLELMRANLDLSQAKLTKAVLSALSSQIN